MNNLLQLKSNPGPSSEVIKQAIEICSAFNSNSGDLKKQLKEMLEVQKHNSQVLSEAKAEVNKVNDKLSELEKKEKDFHDYHIDALTDISTHKNELEKGTSDFVKDKAEFSEYESRTRNELKREELVLKKTRLVIDSDTAKLTVERGDYDRALNKYLEDSKALLIREQKLKTSSESLKELLKNL